MLSFLAIAAVAITLGPTLGAAETLRGTLSVPRNPWGVAVDPILGHVYVIMGVYYGRAELATFDETGHLLSRLDLMTDATAGLPIAVNPQNHRVYVTLTDARSIAIIDGTTNTLIKKVAVPGTPDSVTVNPFNSEVYVTFHWFCDSGIAVLDGNTNEVIKEMRGIRPCSQTRLAIDPLANLVYATTHGQILVIDGATHEVQRTIELHGGTVYLIAVDPIAKLLYLTFPVEGIVATYEATTGTRVPADLLVAGVRALAFNPAAGKLYMVTYDAVRSNGFLALWGDVTIPVGRDARAIAFDPLTEQGFVASYESSSVTTFSVLPR